MTIDEKYLIKPFDKCISKKSFPNDKNKMRIIVGTTGIGKTYSTFNYFMPILFDKNHDLDLIIYSYPQTEVYDRYEADKLIANTKGVLLAETLSEAIEKMEDGFKVLYCGTHHSLIGTKGKEFLNYLENKGIKVGYFVDEPHTWCGCSDIENYREVIGSFTPKYDATIYKIASRIAERSPYVFGTTATPTAEQKRLIDSIGSMEFEIINVYPKLDDIIGRCGWQGGVTEYKLGTVEKPLEELHTFPETLDTHIDTTQNVGKISMMITSGRRNSSNGYDITNVLLMLGWYLKDDVRVDMNETVVIMSSEQTGYVKFDKTGDNYIVDVKTEHEVKNALADKDDPHQILVVIEKGKMGMNIHNLKSYFSFRQTDKKRSSDYDNEPITELPLQIIGRLQRIWTGENNRDFVNKWGYDLTEYVKTLNFYEQKRLLQLNSYNICVPKNPMWEESIRILKKHLSPSTTSANRWMRNLKKSENKA